jgi:hypothetical protein
MFSTNFTSQACGSRVAMRRMPCGGMKARTPPTGGNAWSKVPKERL